LLFLYSTQILTEPVDKGPSALISVDFLRLLDAAELATRGGAGVVERHPAPDVFIGQQVEMGLNLFVQVVVQTSLPEHRKHPGHGHA
jgi:hypothetical protein